MIPGSPGSPGSLRTLTTRELNRAVLARQLLLARAELDVVPAIEQVGCLQNQNATTGYIGLWSRLTGFERRDLTAALEAGSVVQATMMRATIHLASGTDYWPLVTAVRDERRAWWLRATRPPSDAATMVRLAERTAALLADGPRRRIDLVRELGGLDAHHWGGVGLWLDLLRVAPSGTWERRRADLFDLAERRVAPRPATSGVELLVTRYLGAFGPAARRDVQLFTGLPAAVLEPVLAALPLRTFRGPDDAELLDLPDAPLPPADTPAPVRFVGPWEAVLLAHARRADVLPERHRHRVFHTKMPQSTPTFLVDGQVAGTWRYVDGRVDVSPFEPLDDAAAAAVETEAAALAQFHA